MRFKTRLPLFTPVVLFLSLIFMLFGTSLTAQSLKMVSGNGQMDLEQFICQAPMVVQAVDASGKPMAGVAIDWEITQGQGTLRQPVNVTDVNGMASTSFLATSLLQFESFFPAVVTANSALGNVSFFITTVESRTPNGNVAPPPLVSLINPAFENRAFSAAQGSTVAGAVVVQVAAQSGLQQGQAVPNIGMRIINALDPTLPAGATCNAPTGVVLTDSKGFATCDLVITGPPGTTQLTAIVGEIQQTSVFTLTITPGVTCSYSLSAGSQAFGSSGGAATVNVVAGSGCGWTAASNASFITLTAGATGSGNGPVSFSVAGNTGGARSGTITIAGQTFTVNQSASTPNALTIATASSLSPGTTGSPYVASLQATGGTGPYSWSISGSLPPGLVFNNASTATITGTPGAQGTYGFTATVTDSLGAHATQNFSIGINGTSAGFGITNTSFAPGVIGQAYSQLITTSGGCTTPFSPMPAISLTGGALPTGLIIQTNGDFTRSITGTPTAAGTFNFTLTATDACTKTASASFSITVTTTAGPVQQMVVNPTAITFTVSAGGVNSPADQSISVTASTGVLAFNVGVATSSGGNWLVLRSAGNSTPGTITVGAANFAALGAGTYNGTVTITSAASNNPIVVPVSLVVIASIPLAANPNFIAITQTATAGSFVTRRSVVVSSTSQVHFNVTATTQTGGNWLSVSPSFGDTPSSILVSVDSGGLAPGTYLGGVTLTPTGGVPMTLPVTLTVTVATSLAVSANTITFSYTQGSSLPASQLINVSTSGSPVNVSIAAVTQTGGNWLQVDRQNGTAPLSVTISIVPTGLGAGTYNGTVYVVAGDQSIPPVPIGVTLVVLQSTPSISSVTNGASFAPGPVAPGEIVTIFGLFMGPTTLTPFILNPQGRVATLLAGTEVSFDGFPAPIAYTSATQVSVFVPYEVAGKSTTVMTLKYLGVASNPLTLRVIDTSPGIFVTDSSTGQGAILNQDFTINSPQNGAAPGTVISVFATGEGQTNPGGVDGLLAGSLPLPQPQQSVTVTIDGLPATVTYAGGAPTLSAGVLQVNVRIPTGVHRNTSVPISIQVGTATSQAGVTVSIR